MMSATNQCARNQGQAYALALLRIVTAWLFIQHATAKFCEWPISMTDGHGAIPLLSLMGVAGVLEITGSVLLLLGLFVRPAAFILSGQMAVAYLAFHVLQWSGLYTLFTPLLNKGESAVLFCFIFLYLAFAGGGQFALDNRLTRPQQQ